MLTHIDKCSEIQTTFGLSAVKNMLILVGCIIQGKTVNLYDLKDEVGKIVSKHQTDALSHYKRLVRFFSGFSKGDLWSAILLWGISLLKAAIKHLYLGGTEWAIGKFKLHILVLAIDYQGVAIPFYFSIYNHKGVLGEAERMNFLQKAVEKLPILAGVRLLADREFIGNKWFGSFQGLSLFLSLAYEKDNTSKT
jgi:hypothetical protein